VVASSLPQKTADKGVLILAVLHLRLGVWILVVRILVVRILIVRMLVVRMLVVLSLEAHPALPSKALAHGIDWPSSRCAVTLKKTPDFLRLVGLPACLLNFRVLRGREVEKHRLLTYVSSCHRLDLQRLDRWCSEPKCGREAEFHHAWPMTKVRRSNYHSPQHLV
jgi:hypothetical protein